MLTAYCYRRCRVLIETPGRFSPAIDPHADHSGPASGRAVLVYAPCAHRLHPHSDRRAVLSQRPGSSLSPAALADSGPGRQAGPLLFSALATLRNLARRLV